MKYKFHRDFYGLTIESIRKNTVTFLLGTRKCGKTVCLKQLNEFYANSKYIDFKTIPTDEEKYEVFDRIINSVKRDEDIVYLLDEVTYVKNIETKICEIANECADTSNKFTKIVFTGSQSTALEAWSNRAFAGNAGKITVDFLTYAEYLRYKGIDEISPDSYNKYLYEVSDFYNFSSIKDYLKGCLEETIISNANTSNYIFNNECDLIKDNVDILINICYQTLFTLHNQANVQTFLKDNKLKDDIISSFREISKAIGSEEISKRINNSFVGSYSYIKSQSLDVLKQAFVFLKKCDLIVITPVANDLENVPNVYRDLCSDDSKINYKNDLFRLYNVTIKYPMFYVQILKDILQEYMPDVLPRHILGSIVECNARGLLKDGFEYRDEQAGEIDYVNLCENMAVEFTISNNHNNYFRSLPEYINCIMLTKDKDYEDGRIKYINYCSYIYDLSQNKYLQHTTAHNALAQGSGTSPRRVEVQKKKQEGVGLD